MMTLEEFMAEWHSGGEKVLVHTSGSTGKPKPMLVEKQRMINSARVTCRFLGLRPGEIALLCMPLDYIAGKMMVVRSLEWGLRLICVKPCGHPLADVCERIDFAAMVPMQVYNSLQVPLERERLAHIRHLIIGGGSIDDDLAEALAQMPHAVWSTYGMTETLSHIALRRLSGPERSLWYKPFDGIRLSLTDKGCLQIDAPEVCDHRLTTHDMAEIREEKGQDGCSVQYFRIKGRSDNVVCSGGIKIQIEEVEALLRHFLSYPFLLTKKPDPKFGEVMVLLSESPSMADVAEVCRAHIPNKYWIPREYIHVDSLPLTETGKPRRNLF